MLRANRQRNYPYLAGHESLDHRIARRPALIGRQNDRFGLHDASRVFLQAIVHTSRRRVLVITGAMVSSVSAPPTATVPVKPSPVSISVNVIPSVLWGHVNRLGAKNTDSTIHDQRLSRRRKQTVHLINILDHPFTACGLTRRGCAWTPKASRKSTQTRPPAA